LSKSILLQFSTFPIELKFFLGVVEIQNFHIGLLFLGLSIGPL
jgi:hypothetical protein